MVRTIDQILLVAEGTPAVLLDVKCMAPRVLCSLIMTESGVGKGLHQQQNRAILSFYHLAQ